jgi:hypothetical protein
MKEIDPLSFLKAVYMNAELPLSVRMRAAIELMPYTYPKLAVTAQVTEQGFAELLERRLRRLREMENGNGKLIEAPTQEVEIQPMLPRSTVEVRPPLAPTNDRRFRRF